MQLSYFGKPFHGWQIQPNAISVQESLNKAASTILGEDIYTVGAGRTDTGVHARDMWAHFDGGELPDNFLHRMNSLLGPHIALRALYPVKDEAHTRFDALSRTYEYHFVFRKNPFLTNYAWLVYPRPELERMKEAADALFRFEDFSSFSRSRTQTMTNNCKIMKVEWEERDDKLIFTIQADRFLRNMVRAIVGTLVEIGQGKREVGDFADIIAARDRKKAGESAPAHGLYLTKVEYPKDIINGQ
ncbi:MAG TPA: tRNA pseudouridine(38-40) synthase TruA [Cryomorphaceae bacterium]|nr:tRNA pseudouridine(38-40) synthase TruA [Owenweeksia sp.]MBF99701.1 tRNA pseudouridine(38-40) synthase TruA [Owenweeksia sp.]HAD98137.1 tRNA pseudouridine(38-40) synthase TruA [Cryomorphaceae bacterium]HBF19714.1 tRNA pseudouridine(38-40) synthase TruA [Cryomorphaceae bacterium]HCQ16963.1 tRNA pseudouridine(38-40) synthase TruA [Cryomorphaceae bacterium]|tara:strand:- start:107 stop:838 length:732 start_codon:yes stop_codon:yes gene_type:complete